MSMQIYARLLWQIPVLALLAAVLAPELSWYSQTVGAWPIWLLSMPLAAWVRHALAKPTIIDESALISAQVLVFKPANRRLRPRVPARRRAA